MVFASLGPNFQKKQRPVNKAFLRARSSDGQILPSKNLSFTCLPNQPKMIGWAGFSSQAL
jgi:hypothetical protein